MRQQSRVVASEVLPLAGGIPAEQNLSWEGNLPDEKKVCTVIPGGEDKLMVGTTTVVLASEYASPFSMVRRKHCTFASPGRLASNRTIQIPQGRIPMVGEVLTRDCTGSGRIGLKNWHKTTTTKKRPWRKQFLVFPLPFLAWQAQSLGVPVNGIPSVEPMLTLIH